MGRVGAGLALAALAALATAPVAEATPYVHAHRGGPLETVDGVQKPRYPEATMPAFRNAARRGFVLELDVKLSSDRVPVVIHDATLDRTTDCEGRVDQRTAAAIRACEVDVLGTADVTRRLPEGHPRRSRVPRLAQLLRFARRAGAELNLEVKNVPTDPDFDPTGAFAERVAEEIRASGFPPSRLIVQSFWPPNLAPFESDPYFELAATSLLTLAEMNAGGPAAADAAGQEWVSPGWPVDQAYVSGAHALGLQVVPYTLDDRAAIEDAARRGVDAVISNDPRLARRALRAVAPAEPKPPPPPSRAACRAARASRLARPVRAFERTRQRRAPRVFAIQFKQELRHVETYADFRTKIECMIRRYVVPHRARGRPNVVAFNEDVGLMTLATGSRGAAARALFADPESAPSCEPQGAPCGTLAALAAVRAGYNSQATAYQARWPEMPPVGASFVAGTDTFARGWMQLFSDMAKRYRVYILGSNNQAPFRESVDPAEIELFRDPDLPRPDSVYVATRPYAYNEVFMWGPRDVRREGPPMLRNVVAQNKKLPVTPIEELIQIEPGPATGPDAIENVRPYRLPGTRARISFATSLPAFVYGHEIGTEPPPLDPCSDVATYYMRCLDRLGANLVMQDEANPGRWAGPSGEGNYQPLEWMRSTWRAVADPHVRFAYNVTPHMVGNLADIAFDGQTAITQRGLRGKRTGQGKRRRCTYVGNRRFRPGPPENDPAYLRPYARPKRQFIAIAPWVARGSRAELRATSARLAPGSGDELENDYVETAIAADLPFPPDPRRANCVRAGRR